MFVTNELTQAVRQRGGPEVLSSGKSPEILLRILLEAVDQNVLPLNNINVGFSKSHSRGFSSEDYVLFKNGNPNHVLQTSDSMEAFWLSYLGWQFADPLGKLPANSGKFPFMFVADLKSTALHFAVTATPAYFSYSTVAAKMLLDFGAQADCRRIATNLKSKMSYDPFHSPNALILSALKNYTPLAAAMYTHKEYARQGMMKLLLDAAADLTLPITESGGSYLHLACKIYGSSPCVLTALISRGVDVNARDQRGRTPLHVLCECKLLGGSIMGAKYLCPLIETLAESGCDANVRDDDGVTPLIYAIQHLLASCQRFHDSQRALEEELPMLESLIVAAKADVDVAKAFFSERDWTDSKQYLYDCIILQRLQ